MSALSSVGPELIDAIVAAAAGPLASIGAVVSDGDLMPMVGGSAFLVGVDDNDLSDSTAIHETQLWANANYTAANAEGDITCAAYAWSSDRLQKTARDSVFAVLDVVRGLAYANPSWGVDRLLWTRAWSSLTYRQSQTDQGAYALAIVTLHFRARL